MWGRDDLVLSYHPGSTAHPRDMADHHVRGELDREVDRLLLFRGLTSLPRRRGNMPAWCVWLFTFTTGTAVLAAAGGSALVFGVLDAGATTDGRFPAQRPILSGLALIGVVGLPMAFSSIALYMVAPRAGVITTAAGLMLLAWLLAEVAIIGTFGWLEVLFALIAVVIVAGGTRHVRATTTPGVHIRRIR